MKKGRIILMIIVYALIAILIGAVAFTCERL